MSKAAHVIPFDQLRMDDIDAVGGKNASLGEMIGELSGTGIRIPEGFATTAAAFREFLAHNNLEARIAARLDALDVDDVKALARAGSEIRHWISGAEIPRALHDAVRESFTALTLAAPDATWAVRSSATAEDLPDASFAGQQETFLNINGLDNILHAPSSASIRASIGTSVYDDAQTPAHNECKSESRAACDGRRRGPRCPRNVAVLQLGPWFVIVTSECGISSFSAWRASRSWSPDMRRRV